MEQNNGNGLPVEANRNEATMFALIANRDESGLSVKDFCKRYNLSAGIYYYWQKKYRDKNKQVDVKQGGFAVLQLDKLPGAAGNLSAELVLPNGIRVRLYQPVTASFVQSLL